ncbi:glycosyltransferase family 4 protein [Microbacterium dauci]|uniref:Glycosyltransferase family 4 protein n=1 Tax=Microbacterium dauci TaxID=3048008 RepID=A0ABT6ZE83_9MICO|nr:glycosyltransferase family 4 protein [Microbacterium sp. LX3-4]MDJ1114453.1 glycosyltransferase family 4 protein [Microbacterium sp. LX3-4]
MPPPEPAVTVIGVNYPPESTGISPYTGAMARGLTTRGFRPHVITTHPHYPDWRVTAGYGQWSRKEQVDGVSVHRVRHYVPSTPKITHRFASELTFGTRLALSSWRKPSAIVAVSPALFSSILAAVRAKLFHRSTPFIVWVQDLYWLGLTETGLANAPMARMLHAIEGWLLRSADRVVVIHDRFADRVHADFGVPRERIHVVRNWTHLPPRDAVDREKVRSERGWGDEIVVLHAGNMGVKQGLDNVVEAARLAADRGENIRFVLLGGGADKARLQELGAGIPILEFLSALPDDAFVEALSGADILLVNERPGIAEMAVPSKLTSYFSAGRPVLAATDITGITANEVRAAAGGVVVPSGDPAGLLDSALELGRDSTRCDDLGANGKRYRETVLDETFAIDSFATMLETLITGDPAHEVQTAKR